MIKQFFFVLIDKLIEFLASLNPATKAKVDKIKAEAEEQEGRRQIFLAQIAESEKINAKLEVELQDGIAKREALNEAIALSNQKLAEKNAAVLADPDDDIERPLPGAG